MFDRAVILAGGLGTRLQTYTATLPKPLVPVGGTPILETIIQQLVHHGIKHVTLAVNHKAEMIQEYFGDGSAWHVHIDYSCEQKPLSTMGPLKLIRDLPDHFLVMNGDVLTDMNYASLMQYHLEQKALFSIACHERTIQSPYGVLEIADNQLVGFHEKPTYRFCVSMGVYAVSREVLQYIPDDRAYGFDQLMLQSIERSLPVKTWLHHGEWLDIGNIDDYHTANEKALAQQKTTA